MNRHTSGAFDAWVYFLETKKRNRFLVERAARKMKYRAVSKSFELAQFYGLERSRATDSRQNFGQT